MDLLRREWLAVLDSESEGPNPRKVLQRVPFEYQEARLAAKLEAGDSAVGEDQPCGMSSRQAPEARGLKEALFGAGDQAVEVVGVRIREGWDDEPALEIHDRSGLVSAGYDRSALNAQCRFKETLAGEDAAATVLGYRGRRLDKSGRSAFARQDRSREDQTQSQGGSRGESRYRHERTSPAEGAAAQRREAISIHSSPSLTRIHSLVYLGSPDRIRQVTTRV